jgi:hypothetical protein
LPVTTTNPALHAPVPSGTLSTFIHVSPRFMLRRTTRALLKLPATYTVPCESAATSLGPKPSSMSTFCQVPPPSVLRRTYPRNIPMRARPTA